MKKKTMLEKAKAYKTAGLIAGILIPGTGVATILNNMSLLQLLYAVKGSFFASVTYPQISAT